MASALLSTHVHLAKLPSFWDKPPFYSGPDGTSTGSQQAYGCRLTNQISPRNCMGSLMATGLSKWRGRIERHWCRIGVLLLIGLPEVVGCQSPVSEHWASGEFRLPLQTVQSREPGSETGSVSGKRLSTADSSATWFDTGGGSRDIRFQSLDTGYKSIADDAHESIDPGYAAKLELPDPDKESYRESYLAGFVSDVRSDLGNFYTLENIPWVIGGLGLGAWMANTELDQDILDHFQDNVTFASSDELGEFVSEYKFFGEGYFLLPIYAGSAIVGKHFLTDHPRALRVGEWGDRSLRAVLLGTPPLLISQRLLGGSRPGENREASEWQPFGDNNAVSGHAFMGAIPFLTAMQMTDDYRAKAAWFVVSTLPAVSRITDNGHFPSQAFLGWGLACLATQSISKSELMADRDFQIEPILGGDSVGVGVTIER